MSEYWKSLPRKFCDICKCWFADNKASIDFHERGKRHQENAQKRIKDIQKKGIKDFKKQQKLEDDMAKIERAALAAYKKDLQNNAEAVSSNKDASSITLPETHYMPVIPQFKQPKNNVNKSKNMKSTPKTTPSRKTVPAKIKSKKPVLKWQEAMSEDGYKYYWNVETSETRWDAPEEGFVSLEQQETKETEIDTEIKEDTDGEEERSQDAPICNLGPQPKIDPYGQWITVEKKKPEIIDFQLPKVSENVVEVVVPVVKDEPKLTIKEKVIGSLADTDPSEIVTFKKRKFTGSLKRNARQKTSEDE